MQRNSVKKIVFVPYAAHDHDGYETKVKTAFAKWGKLKLYILSTNI